jgi:hypothetical protein
MKMLSNSGKGFTLIAALLLLVLLSALAIGLMYMVNTEARVGSNDLENNLAYYGAEAGMEKMTADLFSLYTANQTPSVATVQALANFPPNVPGVGYLQTIDIPVDGAGKPLATTDTVHAGPNQGLYASIIPMTLISTATRGSGAEVRMKRGVEIALIPVFQFGVFSDSDLSYFPGPSFDFAGRVHTNGNLFLADSNGNGLIFHSRVTAVGEVVRDKLSNGTDVVGDGRNGPVYVPNASAGCDAARPAAHCLNLAPTDGSWLGGVPPGTGAQNGNWTNISLGTYNGWLLNGRTGVRPLQLPFVTAGVGPIQIIRKPPAAGADPAAPSRLYNQAQIRVLLADSLADLHPDRGAGALDADDVQLDNLPAGVNVAGVGQTFMAVGNSGTDPDFVTPGGVAAGADFPLIKGWLRVEIHKTDGTWVGVTNQWLGLGFARGVQAGVTPNPVHPNAILVLQEQADQNGDGIPESGSLAGNNFYPINFYDAREGQIRDNVMAGDKCNVNGIMNALDLDVGNLRRWLLGGLGGSGTLTENTTQNGYVLYFSDRRGMRPDPNAGNALTGEYGFEDTINSGSAAGNPDGGLDPNNPGTTQSPEDVDQNGLLDNWGGVNVGDGFGVNTNTAPVNPYKTVSCSTTGRKNRVTGARHVLRLVNGSLGNVPTRADATGGFTVASENPVYVQGNYNAAGAFGAGNAPAAVIADAVTLLSNNWSDLNDMFNPTQMGNRPAANTWYRLAIAAGKNIDFPRPNWAGSDYGTDGGVHNFLRYIENWGGQTLWYQGSLVSLYYAQYATGVFKCCTTVYSPPTRNYSFDTDFLNPSKLPPGTPQFRDVVNVSYRQDFTPH